MTPEKLNCWQVLQCGREPGGAHADEAGPCPAATETACHGINEGTNAGRICWAVAGAFCRENARDAEGEPIPDCQRCAFFRRVKYEEGTHFQVLVPALGVSDPAELRRSLNDVVRLIGICRDVFACLAVRPLLRRITEHAQTITRSGAATAYLFDSSGESLVREASAGPLSRPERVGPEDDCPVAEAARERTLCRGTTILPGGQSASVAALSVGGYRELAGVLELVKVEGQIGDDDEWFLRQYGLVAGLGIETATLVGDLRQLKRFDKAKSKFVAVLMHHISSPLATIACSLQALVQLGDRLEADDRAALVANSLERIETVQALSRKLLDLASIRAGRSLAEVRPVCPAGPLREEVANCQAEADEQGVEMTVADRSGGAQILADPDGLRLIFANLLGNAVKYTTGPVREVHAEVDADDERVRITVRDTGMGIPSGEQAHIFEEFHRAMNVEESGPSGFGIGLAVVAELVERYGGDIDLDSTVGVGTTFTVSFPLADADGDSPAPS
ncbi:MAG: sensor histidine kinase [Planctomycetota bacterium]